MDLTVFFFGLTSGIVVGVIMGIVLFTRFSRSLVHLLFREVSKVYYGEEKE
jgi:MFS superfamily sulfate permease-like transporter